MCYCASIVEIPSSVHRPLHSGAGALCHPDRGRLQIWRSGAVSGESTLATSTGDKLASCLVSTGAVP